MTTEIAQQDIDYIVELAKQARSASFNLRHIKTSQKNAVLTRIAELLEQNRKTIQEKNKTDVENARQSGLDAPLVDRLILSDKVIDSMIRAVQEIRELTDPVGEIIEGKTLPNGIELRKQRIPIGVVAIIYESRPNVTIDVAALGLKSSNAVILRGGKEALESNRILASLFQQALKENDIPVNVVQLIEKTDRSLIAPLVQQTESIDLIIPRGGTQLIRHVSENSHIPVVKHDKGVCHIFIDESAPLNEAIDITVNSKVQKPSVCNAAETLLLHRSFSDPEKILSALREKNVILRGDEETRKEFQSRGIDLPIEDLTEEGYHREYLALEISVRFVDDMNGAIEHIHEYTSEHSEAIISNSEKNIHFFQQSLNSAAIFVNCSTRFHDGGQFGYGAEMGIATGKLHVRGPMGLRDLTTMKYVITGEGQVRP